MRELKLARVSEKALFPAVLLCTECAEGHMQLFEEACERFKHRSEKVGVLGLGYAGLPLACSFAEAGFEVTGFDIDARKIQEICDGRSYIAHINSKLINRLVAGGELAATSDFARLSDCDATIVCVPTPLAEGTCRI